jgi:hypothetical protein
MFKLFASCDPKYLNVHAPALVASAAVAGNNLHLHVINAEQEEQDFLQYLQDKWKDMTDASFTFSWNQQFMFHQNEEQQRTIFACDRFITIVQAMERNPNDNWLVIDTDCLVMKKIEEPTAQIGIFLREPLPGTVGWENEGSRVAAGAVYYKHESLPFARQVMRRIKHGPNAWFLDQVAINEIYKSMINNYSFHHFDAQFMDWEFIEGTTIWTGKGPRKYDNPTYLTKKNHFDRMIR